MLPFWRSRHVPRARIRDRESYLARFRPTPTHAERQEVALRHALDIRKFEIELYWKRATYFWAFIAATFAGFFALHTRNPVPPYLSTLLIAQVGLVFSAAWHCVNRGSKFWQSNWERHVDALEDEITGPLYKTTLPTDQFPFVSLTGAFPYSVSRINQLLSLFVVTIWLLLTGYTLVLARFEGLELLIARASIVVSVLFIILLLTVGQTSDQPGRVDFETRPLLDADGGNQ
jgi:hypothetical protein